MRAGSTHTPETKAAISASLTGRAKEPAHKAAISRGMERAHRERPRAAAMRARADGQLISPPPVPLTPVQRLARGIRYLLGRSV
jgi:hypothetical protein